jgi:hypothetical protein
MLISKQEDEKLYYFIFPDEKQDEETADLQTEKE